MQEKIKSFDGTELNVFVWNDVQSPKGAVVISHGMAEHAERYARFASLLNANGYVVYADDHRAHKNNPYGERGKACIDTFENTVKDMLFLVQKAEKETGFKPFLIGHSYGSFLSQRFTELYSATVKGVILSGTAYMKTGLLKVGKAVASLQYHLVGGQKTGKLIDKLSFGAFNKGFEAQEQEFAWLSRDKDEVQKYIDDPYCGYPLSIAFYLSFFRGICSMYGTAADSIKKDLPLMIAFGTDDPVSTKGKQAKVLEDFYKAKGLTNVTYKPYDKSRHEILNEIVRDEVSADFISFLDANN
ncbi:MAG: alpha/beta hydrolase [Christensenellaceae bacterium]|jgi:alpha-beta hydrolase superfamily lysophospholipase|nr:alpha/beta hydrolase [Christensenellaceae bacterium]